MIFYPYSSTLDNQPPVIICPPSITTPTDLAQLYATVKTQNIMPSTPTDNVGISSFNVSGNGTAVCTAPASSCEFPASNAYLFVFEATDASNNIAVCSVTITVYDNESPVFFNCPQSFAVVTDQGLSTDVIDWSAPTAADNVGVVSLTVTDENGNVVSPGVVFSVGEHQITYIASDASGNSAVCSFIVNVADAEPPVIQNCPGEITVPTDIGLPTATLSWQPPFAKDNVGVADFYTNFAPGSVFPLGYTTVVYVATDSAGNFATCLFYVNIIDTEPPVIYTCPYYGIQVGNAPGKASAIVSWTSPTETDNVGATISVNYEPGTSFPIGTTDVIYIAADAAGNYAKCQFNVTVADVEAPRIFPCPSNINVPTDFEVNYATVSWAVPQVTDNFDLSPSVTVSDQPGSQFPFGQTAVLYTAVDSYGNAANCSFVITVVDQTVPLFEYCPPDILVGTDSNNVSEISVSWTLPVVTDNVHLDHVTSTNSPGDVFSIGTSSVSYYAFDEVNNEATCTFTITVVDTTPPSWTNCPSSITVYSMTGESVAATWALPTAFDNVGVSSTAVTAASGQFFEPGVSTVTFTAWDVAGNSASCAFNVTVINTCANIDCLSMMDPDSCQTTTGCYNGGCIIVNKADTSKCDDGDARTAGDFCMSGVCTSNKFVGSFGPDSYLSFPGVADVFSNNVFRNEISFDFATTELQGLLFQNGGQPGFDYIRAYILGGDIYWEFDLGSGPGTVTSAKSGVKYNDGLWHHVSFSRSNNNGTLVIDSATFKARSPGNSRQLNVVGSTASWNFIVGNLPSGYIGSSPTGLVMTNITYAINKALAGCIQNLVVNGVSLGLPQTIAGPKFAATNDFLQCASSNIVSAASFYGNNSYMAFSPLSEVYNSIENSFKLNVELSFESTKANGLILYNGDSTSVDFVSLELSGGLLLVQVNFGGGTTSGYTNKSGPLYHDGQWHHVKISISNNTLNLTVDGSIVVMLTSNYPSYTILNLHNSMFLGSMPPADAAKRSAYVWGQNFNGCIRDITVNGNAVSFSSNILLRNVFECGFEQFYHVYQESIPISACLQYSALDPTRDTNVFPGFTSACAPPATSDPRSWRYENGGYFQCRSTNYWLSGCIQYKGSR